MNLPRGARVSGAAAFALAVLFTASSARNERAPSRRATTIGAPGRHLRVVEAGSGQPIVLLHGYGESLVAWQGVFERLAPRARVIALDLPGFGLSSKPRSGYQTDSIAAVVVDALRALNVDSAVLVGHSLGGAVAAAVTASAPALVRALVLVDAALVPPRALPGTDSSVSARLMRAAVTAYEIMRTRFTSPHAPTWLAESDSALGYSPAADSAYAIALEAVLREFDFSWLTPERAAAIPVPVLVIWGRFDRVIPAEDGRRIAEAIPGARFSLIDRSWHRPHVERPAETAQAIADFVIASP